MVLYVGDSLGILLKATDPDTGLPLNPPPISAVVDYWAPGVDRKTQVPSVPQQSMVYRVQTNDFVFYQDTQGWSAGKWTYRVTITGSTYKNVEYSTFKLNL